MTLLRDLRYSARSLSRSPGLTAALLLTTTALVVPGLTRAAPGFAAPAMWSWLACPAALVAIVRLAGILPARYALAIDPLTPMREE